MTHATQTTHGWRATWRTNPYHNLSPNTYSPHRHRHPNASLGPSLSLSPSPKQESRVAHFHCLNDLGEAIPVHVKSHIPNPNPKA